MNRTHIVHSAGGICLLVLASLACGALPQAPAGPIFPSLPAPRSPASPPPATLETSPHLDRGREAFDREQYDEAIDELTAAIADVPDDAYAYYLRGSSYYNRYSDAYPDGDTEDFYRAITDFTKAIEINHNYAEAYNFRALAFAGFGQNGHALDDYNMAIQLEPDLATAYYGRGLVYEQQGETQPAIEDYRRFLELSHDEYWRREAEKRLAELEASP